MPETLPLIYVDTCCFITLTQHKTKFLPDFQGESEDEMAYRKDQADQSWFLDRALGASRDKKVRVITSFLTIAEATKIKNGGEPVPLEAKTFLEMTLCSGKSGVSLVTVTRGIAERARDLRWVDQLNLQGADSIHIASAISMRCNEFWTGERKGMSSESHRGKIESFGPRVCKPQDTKLLPPDYLQMELGD